MEALRNQLSPKLELLALAPPKSDTLNPTPACLSPDAETLTSEPYAFNPTLNRSSSSSSVPWKTLFYRTRYMNLVVAL